MENISIMRGNLLNANVEAIVNPVNSTLNNIKGISKSICYIAGKGMTEELKKFSPLKIGNAEITSGYNIDAQNIIHVAVPCWKGGYSKEAEMLRTCYRAALKLADKNNIVSIGFPSLATEISDYPIDEACEIAIATIKEYLQDTNSNLKVYIVLDNMNLIIKYRTIIQNEHIDIGNYLNRRYITITEELNNKEKMLLKKKPFQKVITQPQIEKVVKLVIKRALQEKYPKVILLDEQIDKSKIGQEIYEKYKCHGPFVTYDMAENIVVIDNTITFDIFPATYD